VPVQKNLLPHDPEAHPQAISAALAPDGTVYAGLASIICKSTDGGRTWTAHEGSSTGPFVVLRDGTFIGLAGEGEHPNSYAIARSSSDEGRTWRKTAEFRSRPGHWTGGSWIFRLPDDTLLAAISDCDYVFDKDGEGKLTYKSGGADYCVHRSTDGGQTWAEQARGVHSWAGEGGLALTASGRLLEAHRHQRPTMPDDPPDLEQRMVSITAGWPYKHVFVVESDDLGRTWKGVRQLTTVFGQTHGSPVALADGTVIVIHDTRYGPGHPGSRAMVSRDEGRTWEDEVYYLDYTTFTGSYAASVALEGDVVLSVVGSSQAGNDWEAVKDNTDFYAIRWEPARE